MYAVIEQGSRQHKVQEGDVITVNRITAEVGSTVDVDRVLLIGGEETKVGNPVVDGAQVQAEVVSHGQGDKRLIYKYRRTRSYRRLRGARPAETTLKITTIKG